MNLSTIIIFLTLSINLSLCNYCSIEVKPNPDYEKASCYGGTFDKYADVFGLRVYGTIDITECQVKQVAYIAYGLLDNNYDGTIDNEDFLKAQLSINKGRTTLIFGTQDQKQTQKKQVFGEFDDLPCDGGTGATYLAVDMLDNFNGSAVHEEWFHMFCDRGMRKIYPEWRCTQNPDSESVAAMDAARGGKFTEVPAQYPAGAWYTYLPPACDYCGCQLGEYIWHLGGSYYGIEETYPAYCDRLKNEWTPCSREELKTMDVLGYAFISDPKYNLPTQTPKNYVCGATADQGTCPTTGPDETAWNTTISGGSGDGGSGDGGSDGGNVVDGGSDTGNAIDGGSDNDDIGSGYYSISMSIFALFIISLVRFQ